MESFREVGASYLYMWRTNKDLQRLAVGPGPWRRHGPPVYRIRRDGARKDRALLAPTPVEFPAVRSGGRCHPARPTRPTKRAEAPVWALGTSSCSLPRAAPRILREAARIPLPVRPCRQAQPDRWHACTRAAARRRSARSRSWNAARVRIALARRRWTP